MSDDDALFVAAALDHNGVTIERNTSLSPSSSGSEYIQSDELGFRGSPREPQVIGALLHFHATVLRLRYRVCLALLVWELIRINGQRESGKFEGFRNGTAV